MKPQYKKVCILSNEVISKGIYKLKVNEPALKDGLKIKPGQFYMLRSWKSEPMLSRPISVSSVNAESITFLYAVIGKGTEFFTKLSEGDEIEVLGPLGNGFDSEKISGKVAIVAGGIGIAPMIQLAKEIKNCKIDIYAGFRSESYGIEALKDCVDKVHISTEDGSEGYKGYVTDLINVENYDMVLCCGPEIMMYKVLRKCREFKVPIYVSMEKHMACGVGACLVCTCKTKDGHKRTCKEGPVFSGDYLEIGGEY
jgi:dihydroorotate dehydrogenase electron transfer subunit